MVGNHFHYQRVVSIDPVGFFVARRLEQIRMTFRAYCFEKTDKRNQLKRVLTDTGVIDTTVYPNVTRKHFVEMTACIRAPFF